MIVTPPSVLHAYAALVGTGPGKRLARAAIRGLITRGMPIGGVEAVARRTPSARGSAEVSPILVPLELPSAFPEGPLSGQTVVVKDSLDVAGYPTGIGLPGPGERAETDAVLVQRIRAAGGALIGKASMTELGMDGTGALIPGEVPDSAVTSGYLPGGSSTGSAIAVARGVARYAVGGDGLGSVRIPAAFAGLVGLKPGRGTLPLEGYRPVSASMEEPGPIARDVADCARLHFVLAGQPDVAVAARAPAEVGIVAHLGPELASRDQRAAFERMLDALAARRRPQRLPGAEGMVALAVAVCTVDLAGGPLGARTRSGQGRLNVALGASMRSERGWIERRRDALRADVQRLFEEVEVLAMPTTATPPPAASPGLLAGGQDLFALRTIGAYTPLANLCGLAAISVPSGRDDRGRPLATMFVGRAGSELRLLEIAAAAEATGLGTRPI